MASFWDSITGEASAEAALKAARETAAAGKQAQTQYGQAAGQFQPWQTAGTGALQQLLAGLGLGGPAGSAAYTNAYRSTPGYTAGLDMATTGALRAQNAGPGSLGGTRAMMNVGRKLGDYESMREGDFFNRLAGVSGAGQQATGQATGLIGQGIGTRFGADTQAALGGVAAEQAKQSALTNLLSMSASLGGSFLGGPGGGALGKGLFGSGAFGASQMNPSTWIPAPRA